MKPLPGQNVNYTVIGFRIVPKSWPRFSRTSIRCRLPLKLL